MPKYFPFAYGRKAETIFGELIIITEDHRYKRALLRRYLVSKN